MTQTLLQAHAIDRRAALRWLCAPAVTTAMAGVMAQDAQPGAGRYTQGRASTGGTGKRYMGREIAGVMGFQGAAWLERQEREKEERGDLLLRELGVKPGMAVADIGAGSGYYTRRLSPLVGASGMVYAVDVQAEMLQLLTAQAAREKLTNIRPVLGTADDVKLPAASVDLALMVDVYHELEFPFELMETLVRALKPGGRVAFVEYRAEDRRVPILEVHKMTEAQVRLEAAKHALVYERTARSLPWQHLVIFRKR